MKTRHRRIKLVLLAATLLCAASGVCSQWTQLWEYVPTNAHSASQQEQPLKRAAHSLVVFKDSLYVFGGVGDTNDEEDHEFDDTWRFDLVNQRWKNIVGDREGNPKGTNGHHVSPQHRSQHSTAIHSNATVNEMIVFGGLSVAQKVINNSRGIESTEITVTQFNDVWRLSLDIEGKETWRCDDPDKIAGSSSGSSKGSGSSTTVEPTPRAEATSVVHNGLMYVFGGISYDEDERSVPENFAELWVYNLSDMTWKLIPPVGNIVPPARFSHSMTKFTDDKGETFLVVFGGRHLEMPTWTVLGDTWTYSLSTGKWMQADSSVAVQRAYTSVLATGGATPKMWFFGGYYRPRQGASGYVYDDVVGGFLTASNTTTLVQFNHAVVQPNDVVPPLRYNHRAVLWRDMMVVHGGSYQSQRGDVWMFNLTSAVWRQDSAVVMPVNMQTLIYVLAGFVFSIIFVLVVLIIRWRRIDRRNLELARQRGVSVMRGVAKERLDQMGVTKYKKPPQDTTAPPTPTPADDDDFKQNNEDICPICLIEFEEDEDVRNLPCKHLFHVACIDEWLSRNTTCPMCKNNLDLQVVDVEILADGTDVGTNERRPSLQPLQPRQSQSGVAQPRGGSIVTPVMTGNP